MRYTPPLLAVALGAALSSSALAEWSQYHGPTYNRTTSETVNPANIAAAGPKVLWRVPMSRGFSSFVVGDGRAFTQVLRDVDGLEQEVLVSLNADTGEELWAKPVGLKRYRGGGDAGSGNNKGGDGPRSTPSIDGDTVIVLSSDLALQCFDAAKGELKWKLDIEKNLKGENITWKNAASPVVFGDLIYCAGGGRNQALIAVNKKNGQVVWKTQSDVMTHATPTIAKIHGQAQVIFFTKSGLVSLKPESGELLWRQNFPFKTSTAASPVVDGDLVYCSAGYGVGAAVYKITKNGNDWSSEEVWFLRGTKPVVNHWSTPVLHNGFLYGMFSFKEYGDGPVKCVDMKTGTVLWEQEGFGPGNIILAGDKLIALGDAGQVALIDTKTSGYTELAKFDVVDGKCWSTPILCDGRLYIRSTTEGVCIDVTGK